jgi:methionyl-tRNA formyltransferase
MRIVMMGTGTFAEPTFEALFATSHPVIGLVTQPDRPVGHERATTRQGRHGMKEIAQQHGIPVLQPESINAPEGVAALRELRPDLLVVAAFGQILSNDVLASAPHGGINIHASLLPKYRGAAPVAWAIYHGETRTGVTIIRMSLRLDAGDILAQEAVDIGLDETAGELETRLATLGAGLAVRVIDEIAAGTAKGTKQDPAQVTKAPKLRKEHGLIDWGRSAEQVSRQVRAMQPWPTAYTFLHRQGKPPMRVLVHRAAGLPAKHDPLVPAGALFIDPRFPGALFVAAGLLTPEERSVLQVLQLQPAGKRPMTSPEFLRGHPLQPGDRFGPPPS